MDKIKKDIAIGLFVFAIVILFLYFFWENNIILVISFLAISGVILLKFSSRGEKVLYFVCFILAPVFDLILVPRGVWTYGNPSIFDVPLWLPFTYGISIVVMVKIGGAISKLI